jgi:23S rRNA G2445 N2-methylase RlmL
MKIALFCPIGIEDVLHQDIKELIGKDSEQRKGCCLVETTEQEFVKLAYRCQSIERIGLLVLEQKIINSNIKNINLEKADLSHIKEKFSINAKVLENDNFGSLDLVTELSDKIVNKTNKIPLYKGADITYYSYVIEDILYLIIDISTKELTKRDYKVFVNKISLRGTIAYAISRISKVNNKDIVLDPFTKSGEIAIELVHHFIKKSVHFYAKERFNFKQINIIPDFESIDKEINLDGNVTLNATDSKMPNIKAAEKNAKISGINKQINFSRLLIEDLDLKYNNEITKAIVHLPAVGNNTEQVVLKLYEKFFKILNLILKNKALVSCVGVKIGKCVDIAEKNNLKLIHKRKIMQGKDVLDFYMFEFSLKKK